MRLKNFFTLALFVAAMSVNLACVLSFFDVL